MASIRANEVRIPRLVVVIRPLEVMILQLVVRKEPFEIRIRRFVFGSAGSRLGS